MPMHDRRTFLRTAACTTFGLPVFLAAFRQDPQPGRPAGQDPTAAGRKPTRAGQLAAAVGRSRQQDRPLLVFVVPDDPQAVWDRGLWFGAFLNHGDPPALLELALCVPACATVGEVRRHTGDAPIADDPVLLVVDFDADGSAAVTPVTGTLAPIAHLGPGGAPDLPYSERLAREEQAFEQGIETLTKDLHRAMQLAGHTVASLADRARARLDDGQRRALAAWFDGGPPPGDELLVRATAIVRDAAGRQGDRQRAATLEVLLGAIDRVLIRQRIAGSKWASSSGCGVEVEQPDLPEEQLMVACGMGHVPALAQRFLQFLNDG